MQELQEFFGGSLTISPELAKNLDKCFLVPLRVYRFPNDRSLIFSCDREYFPSVAGASPLIHLDQRFLSPLKNRIITKLSKGKWRNSGKVVIPLSQMESKNNCAYWPLACANLECLLRCKRCNISESDRPGVFEVSRRNANCTNDMCDAVLSLFTLHNLAY